MKIDFLDVVADAIGTLFGRMITVALTINFGMGLGIYFGAGYGLVESQVWALPFLVMSVFSTSIIFLPLLFGFAILFVRYEWPLPTLIIPLILSFLAGY